MNYVSYYLEKNLPSFPIGSSKLPQFMVNFLNELSLQQKPQARQVVYG